jgi:hypothetical protein
MIDEKDFTSLLNNARELEYTFAKITGENRGIARGEKVFVLGMSYEEELRCETLVLTVTPNTSSESRVLLLKSCRLINEVEVD